MLSATPRTATIVMPLALLLVACPDDDGSADPEATADTGTEADTGTGAASTDGGPGSGTTAVSTSGSTTEALDDTDDGTTGDGTTGDGTTGDGTTGDGTTGEPPPTGTCVGLEQVGNTALVLSRDGMPIDTTCDPDPAACGGDPVASWVLEATCGFEAFPNPLEADCPGSTFALEILSQSGTMTFTDDGTVVQDFDIQSQVVFTLDPMACFGIDCAAWEMEVRVFNPGATCEAVGPTCSCTIPDNGMSEQVMGTYEVMDDALVITTVYGTQTFPFCVGGDRLSMWQPLYDVPVATFVECTDSQDCADVLGKAYDEYVCTQG
jgi:hypothetical protein